MSKYRHWFGQPEIENAFDFLKKVSGDVKFEQIFAENTTKRPAIERDHLLRAK